MELGEKLLRVHARDYLPCVHGVAFAHQHLLDTSLVPGCDVDFGCFHAAVAGHESGGNSRRPQAVPCICNGDSDRDDDPR